MVGNGGGHVRLASLAVTTLNCLNSRFRSQTWRARGRLEGWAGGDAKACAILRDRLPVCGARAIARARQGRKLYTCQKWGCAEGQPGAAGSGRAEAVKWGWRGSKY